MFQFTILRLLSIMLSASHVFHFRNTKLNYGVVMTMPSPIHPPLNEPSPFNSGTGVLLLKTGPARGQAGNQGSGYGIEGEKSEILEAPTDGVNQDIFLSHLSGNGNKAPLMSAWTSTGQQEFISNYGGEHFTKEKVAESIKLAIISNGRNRNLEFIAPPIPTSENVRDAIPTIWIPKFQILTQTT
ncbi:hypothetical protein OIU85_024304 [Salix viminalis]|uniref:Uncharacterized protein n=1 Tax=Salix viminalis TaxID=40686 RepID=A0A9Q0Z4U2_SALVM|nr:hypothetical protein OIU85_024304 [Salix viminalis]